MMETIVIELSWQLDQEIIHSTFLRVLKRLYPPQAVKDNERGLGRLEKGE